MTKGKTAHGINFSLQRARAKCEPPRRLLWLHGYTMNMAVWDPIFALLPHLDHVALDLPGHGLSRSFHDEETYTSLAEDVLGVADLTDATDLVAMSFGGTIALQTAIQSPERFGMLFLASPGIAGGPIDRETADCNQELSAMARERGLGPWISNRWMSHPPRIFSGLVQQAEERKRVESIIALHKWTELLRPTFGRLASERQTEAQIRTILCQTTIIVGDNDIPAFIRCSEIIRRNVPGARRIFISNSCHLPFLEQPKITATLLAETARNLDSSLLAHQPR